jgi:phosphotransacetylase
MKLGVTAANDPDVLSAVVEVKTEKIAEPILIGEKEKIHQLAEQQAIIIRDIQIINVRDETEAAETTAQLAADNEIQMVMKGFIQTSTLLKTLLNPIYKLKIHDTLSHCALMTTSGYHKLLNITDGGMILEPTIEQKVAIIKNAVLVANALGIMRPKIALHSASDFVNPALKSTLDCAILTKMAQRGQLGEVEVDGPLTLDCALIPDLAKNSGIDSAVAGDTDVLLVSTIEEGNIIAKALINFADAIFSGIVVGAKVPIGLVSRTDSSYNKKSSIALAVVLADYIGKQVW